jgi:hypothetical protein
METSLKKRSWFFLQKPNVYAIAGCQCGNENTQWSEYEHHIWCDKCEKDFIPKHNGVFDGPILIQVSKMMGMSFSKFNIETEKVEVLDSDNDHAICEKMDDILEKKYILISIKSIFDTSKKILSKLILENNEICIVSNEILNTEIFIDYPNTKHFILNLELKEGRFNIVNNDDFKNFNILMFKNLLDEKLTLGKSVKITSKI